MASITISRALSPNQAKAAALIREQLLSGECLSNGVLIDAHVVAYGGIDRKTAATYAGRNMRRENFLAELPAQSPEAEREFKLALWQFLRGTHPLHPNNVQLMVTAARILATLIYPTKRPKSAEVTEDSFAGRTVEELEHYARTGTWPARSKQR